MNVHLQTVYNFGFCGALILTSFRNIYAQSYVTLLDMFTRTVILMYTSHSLHYWPGFMHLFKHKFLWFWSSVCITFYCLKFDSDDWHDRLFVPACDEPAQRPVSFCRASKMSLASIMKTVFICLELRVEIFICFKHHCMLIPSLYTWFAWAKRDPTGLGRPRIDTEGKPALARSWSGDTCSLDYAADLYKHTNWIKTQRRQEVTRFGRVPPITWTSVE